MSYVEVGWMLFDEERLQYIEEVLLAHSDKLYKAYEEARDPDSPTGARANILYEAWKESVKVRVYFRNEIALRAKEAARKAQKKTVLPMEAVEK